MTKPRDIELLEALFVGDDVETDELVRAMQDGADDASFRQSYDELAFADRAVGGDFESRVGEAMFLSALDEMLEEEAAEDDDNVVHLDAFRPRAPFAMYAAAAALLAMASLTLVQSELRTQPEFQARSAATTAPGNYEKPNFEIFCVERDGGDVTFTGRNESEFATVRCPADAEIKFAVQNLDVNLRHVAFFGIADNNTLYWYGPSPATPGAVPIGHGSELEPVGETIRLGVNHTPGTVRVVGLFSERPTDWSDVRSFVANNIATLRDGRLTLSDGMVVRQTFEVSEP